MKTQRILILFLGIVVATVLLAFSTWRQWNDNQGTILERMRPIPPMATYSQGASINYIAFDPKNPELIAADSGSILSADSDYIVKVWNLNNQETPILTLKTHKEQNESTFMVGLGFSPINNWIATQTFKTLEIWDSTSGNKINTLNTTSSNFAISPVENKIALDYRGLTIWDFNDPKNIKGKILLPPLMGWEAIPLGLEKITPYPKENRNLYNKLRRYSNAFGSDDYKAIDFSHDGRWLAAGGKRLNENSEWKQIVKIWDLHKHQLYKIIDRDEPKIQKPKGKEGKVPANRPSTSNNVRSIKFSPDNRFFGLAADNGLTIWSLPEWDIYHEVLDQRIRDIAFSPDGTMFAITDIKGITLWSVETLAPIALLQKVGLIGSSVIEFSPDGNTLAGGGFGGVLRLWDVRKLNEK